MSMDLDLPNGKSLHIARCGDRTIMIIRQDLPDALHTVRLTLSEDDMRMIRDWLDMALRAGTSLLCPPDCPLCGGPYRAYGHDGWRCPRCGIMQDRVDLRYGKVEA